MGVKDCLNHANILLSLLIIEAGHISTPWENSEGTGLAGKVSEVHISQNISPDVLLEHSVPSSCLVPPDSFTLSNDNVAMAIQTANVINPAVLKEQNQVDIQVASLNLSEVMSAIGTDGNETKRQNELKSSLQQTVANLETKLCTAEEEKIKTKKELEYLLEENSILEMNFLKDKKEKLLKYQDHYKMIQLLQGFTNKQISFIQENLNVEKHKQELEDMRQAGHEALSIIVEEFKACLAGSISHRKKIFCMDSSYDTTWKLSLKQCFTDVCVSELDQLMEWSNTGSSLWHCYNLQFNSKKQLLKNSIYWQLKNSPTNVKNFLMLRNQEKPQDLCIFESTSNNFHLEVLPRELISGRKNCF
ncbi:coiled-coil domain-containing protein 91 isoform X15 [Anas acuta]|uniref:coiled-coil domain-containing protein 91 isoform X15 n=1 Tax=Anas acuta TaxID=28680 RepID=UPI0035C90462